MGLFERMAARQYVRQRTREEYSAARNAGMDHDQAQDKTLSVMRQEFGADFEKWIEVILGLIDLLRLLFGSRDPEPTPERLAISGPVKPKRK